MDDKHEGAALFLPASPIRHRLGEVGGATVSQVG